MIDWHYVSDHISFVLLWAAWGGGSVLALSYAIFFRWFRTRAGRAFMQVVAAFWLLLTLAVVARSTGDDYVMRELLRPIAFLFIAYSTIRVSFIMWTGWWKGEDRPLQQEPIRFKRTKHRRAEKHPLDI